MQPNVTHYDLPPVIRVFLSSTFADMERERSYFNEVLVPQLNRICAQRGVSFFSVDLRWGITQEEQVNGQVLPICLSEIDKCRPFFIGILGSRYGSVMEQVPPQAEKTIPWLAGKEGHGITELEMLYAVLDRENGSGSGNCAFYLRHGDLSAQWYGPAQEDPRLTALKQRIQEDPEIPCAGYGDLEEFGRLVMADILQWLDREFPVPEKADEVRRAWYDRELLRGYIDVPQMHRFLDAYFEESGRSLMVWGDGARGKTTALTAWQPPRGHKLLVNCGSDDAYLYWPSIARQIVKGLMELWPDCEYANMKSWAAGLFQPAQDGEGCRNADFFFATDDKLEDFRLSFLAWLQAAELPQPVTVVINDLNLLEDERSHLLSWLPISAHGNVRFLCSTNNAEIVSNAEALGWNCKEMPSFPREYAGTYLENYLHIYGKSLAPAQMQTLLGSGVTAYPGQLRFMADFLIDCGRFENLDQLIAGLAAQTEPRGVYRYVFDFAVRDLSPRELAGVRTVFGLLRCARTSLNEPACFRLTAERTGITAMEWAKIRGIFEQFELIRGDYWNMRELELENFVDTLLSPAELAQIHSLLGDDMLRQLHGQDQDRTALGTIRENTAFAQAALFHYRSSESWDKLLAALMDDAVLRHLAKLNWPAVRVAWVDLILHTQVEISSPLLGLLDRYREGSEEDRAIAMQIAGLFMDLELRSFLPQVYERMGTDQIPSGLHPEIDQISSGFVRIHNALTDLKNQGQFRQLLAQVDRMLGMKIDFTPIDLCQLLFFKADCESHLQLVQEFLETANRYYTTAIQAASLYDLRRALNQRGDALYRLNRDAEAVEIQRQVSRLALRDGDLRSHLAARNVLAMCLYRVGKFDESVAEYDAQHACWTRVGDAREAATCLLNKANALYLSGDSAAALNTARTCLESLPRGNKTLYGVHTNLVANMGAYALDLGQYAQAEAYLLDAVRKAEALGQESTLLHSRASLIKLYQKTDRFMKAVEQYRRRLELLWKRREYTRLTEDLQEAVKLLVTNNYGSMAEELQAQWEAQFAQIEGGKEFFRQQVHSGTADTRQIDQARERLALARSSGDPIATGYAHQELSQALKAVSRDQAAAQLLEAAACFRTGGQEELCVACLTDSLTLQFNGGKLRDPALYQRTLDMVQDPNFRRGAELWAQVGASQTGADIPGLLRELTQCGREQLTLHCLADVVALMTAHCTPEQIIALIGTLSPRRLELLASRLDRAMLKNCETDIDALTRDYQSPEALEKIAYYEKCVQVLQVLKSNNVPTLAGNLAVIFRRRKDQEKTLYYHNLATELFKANGKTRDYLSELINTATAYNAFGQTDRALELLRQGMTEAAAAGQRSMEASMAGNLASMLTRRRVAEDKPEILRCYAIEERLFRETESPRDLVISLLNQVIYLQGQGEPDQWRPKLEEAAKLVQTYHFREFEQTVDRLERKTAAQDQAVQLLNGVLGAGNYRIQRIAQENGAFHAICEPAQESKTEAELLHLLLDPQTPDRVGVIFLCQPKLTGKGAAEAVEQYVDWWNQQGQYRLQLRPKQMVLQADTMLPATAQAFAQLCRLWHADKTSLVMLCVGMATLEECQNLKRKALAET